MERYVMSTSPWPRRGAMKEVRFLHSVVSCGVGLLVMCWFWIDDYLFVCPCNSWIIQSPNSINSTSGMLRLVQTWSLLSYSTTVRKMRHWSRIKTYYSNHQLHQPRHMISRNMPSQRHKHISCIRMITTDMFFHIAIIGSFFRVHLVNGFCCCGWRGCAARLKLFIEGLEMLSFWIQDGVWIWEVGNM